VLLFSRARDSTSLEDGLITEAISIHVLLTTAC
jgi:hypothetical protein